MSIISQLFSGKITFSQAESQAETWFSTILSKAPASVQGDVATGLSDLKQAASDAVGLADTALGGILGELVEKMVEVVGRIRPRFRADLRLL